MKTVAIGYKIITSIEMLLKTKVRLTASMKSTGMKTTRTMLLPGQLQKL
uniref:Uncharacterized protein n=1 Tax=Arundo donax TaxID=35708 RepID=A0A0A9CXS0_ARUDO